MGRAKQYDRKDLLDRAVELFRRKGFHGTSTADLVAELGVNRKSMYAEFGSKQGLFEAALEHYDAHSLSAVLQAVEAPDADLEAIRTTFDGFVEASREWAQGRGCLLCNTAVERVTLEPSTGRHVDAYFARLNTAFGNALANARSAGELGADADVEELGAFFTMTLLGIATLAKGQARHDRIEAANRVAMGVLESHTTG